jgi:hypothetical protein
VEEMGRFWEDRDDVRGEEKIKTKWLVETGRTRNLEGKRVIGEEGRE